jgi:hypothetical protein
MYIGVILLRYDAFDFLWYHAWIKMIVKLLFFVNKKIPCRPWGGASGNMIKENA